VQREQGGLGALVITIICVVFLVAMLWYATTVPAGEAQIETDLIATACA
jgi:hypothetical protein